MSDYQSALIEAAQDFHAHEMNVGPDAFWRWAERVENLLGLETNRFGAGGLDGNQEIDGYCLDFAHDAFVAGWTAKEYVASVLANPIFKAR